MIQQQQSKKGEILQRALQLKGYLNKKGTTGLHVWKKRYFYFLKTSQTICLLYADRQEDEIPIGEINLQEIKDIQYKEKKKQFILVHSSRNFKLEASCKEDVELWVNNIKILQQHAQNLSNMAVNNNSSTKLRSSYLSNRTSDSPCNSQASTGQEFSSQKTEGKQKQKSKFKKVSQETLMTLHRKYPFKKSLTQILEENKDNNNNTISSNAIVNDNIGGQQQNVSNNNNNYSQISQKQIKKMNRKYSKYQNRISSQMSLQDNFIIKEDFNNQNNNNNQKIRSFFSYNEEELEEMEESQDFVESQSQQQDYSSKQQDFRIQLVIEKQKVIKKLEKKLNYLKKDLDSTYHEKEEFFHQSQKYKLALKEEKINSEHLQEENNRLKMRIEKLLDQQNQMDQIVEKTEQDQNNVLKNFQQSIKQKDQQIKLLENDLQNQEKQAQDFNQEIISLKEDLEYANTEASKAKVSYAELQQDVEEQNERNNYLEKFNLKLVNELDLLKKQMQQHQQQQGHGKDNMNCSDGNLTKSQRFKRIVGLQI